MTFEYYYDLYLIKIQATSLVYGEQKKTQCTLGWVDSKLRAIVIYLYLNIIRTLQIQNLKEILDKQITLGLKKIFKIYRYDIII